MREKNNKELNSVYVVNEKYQIVYIDDAFKENTLIFKIMPYVMSYYLMNANLV